MNDEEMQRYMKEERAQEFRTKNMTALLESVPVIPASKLADLKGERLGGGTTRTAYAVVSNPHVVVKEARPGAAGANWTEYVIWNAARVTRWAGVLGQVHSISDDGNYLLMERLCDLIDDDRLRAPDVPYWLNDLKFENFGKSVDGANAIKARDYAVVNLAFELEEGIPYTAGWKRVRIGQ